MRDAEQILRGQLQRLVKSLLAVVQRASAQGMSCAGGGPTGPGLLAAVILGLQHGLGAINGFGRQGLLRDFTGNGHESGLRLVQIFR